MQRYFSCLATPTTPCLLPSLCGECFPGCLVPSLCGDCICVGLGLGTHGFGFGHGGGRMTFCKRNGPLTRLPKKTRKIAAQQSVDCKSLTPTQGATQQSVDCKSLTPTQGATQQSVDCESLTPTQGATQQSVDCKSLTPTQGATQQSVGKRNKKESKNAVPHLPLKEFGTALGPGLCSECRIFTSQQTTFV